MPYNVYIKTNGFVIKQKCNVKYTEDNIRFIIIWLVVQMGF